MELLPSLDTLASPPPAPQVDYYLGLDAQRFLGNSVSTFTAFIMLERKWAHRWACLGAGRLYPCRAPTTLQLGPGLGHQCWRAVPAQFAHQALPSACQLAYAMAPLPSMLQASGALQRRRRAPQPVLPLL